MTIALSPAAHAQTFPSGHYDNAAGVNADGYDTVIGQSYVVTPSATFNNNGLDGLSANGSSVRINGGTFNKNGDYGLLDFSGSIVSIYGGIFSGNLHGISVQSGGPTAVLNLYGGSITNTRGDGLTAEDNAVVNIYGGTFSSINGTDLVCEGSLGTHPTITLYGDFSQYGLLTDSSGSITGTLADNSSPQTITYSISGGQIILAHTPPAAPEPTPLAVLGVGTLGLMARVLRARKRCVDSSQG